jgi:hypothetical protein
MRRMKMFGGVLVWGRVAAAHVATRHADAQVNPGAADAQAVFTSIGAGRDFFNLIEVCTGVSHMILLVRLKSTGTTLGPELNIWFALETIPENTGTGSCLV